ncbi:hypothetical protein EZS27_012366 [termite gut metagenome]|uniref:Uncharacterized protein n=1 Tax=termite gut metagenome TaxID=433724 RepID=A0A5J4S2R8_9ZZZZ
MEKKYKSMTIFEFQEQFKDDMDCLGYLSELEGDAESMLFVHTYP